MNKIYFTLAVFLVFNLSNLVVGQSFYVSTSGSDGNSGSEAFPWRTIQKACNSATPGSTVYIKSGTYNESYVTMNVEGSINNFITFRNFNSDVVTLTRNDNDTIKIMIYMYNKSYIRFVGLKFSNMNFSVWGGAIFMSGNSSNIEIINCEFSNLIGPGSPIITDAYPFAGRHDKLLISHNKIHDCSSSSFNTGILIYTGYGDSIKIVGNDLYNISGTNGGYTKVIMVEGRDSILPYKNMLIDSNKVHDCVIRDSEAISTSGNVEYFTISHNLVYNINNIGIGLAGGYNICPNPSKDFSRYFVIRENLVYNCRHPTGVGAGIYLDGVNNCIVERNTVYESNQGINIGCEKPITAYNNIIRDNNVYNCDRAGILVGEYSLSGIVTNCKVLNNTLFKNLDSSISVYEADFGCSKSYNCEFKNNVIYKSVRNPDNVRTLIGVQPGTSGNIFDYNVYYYPLGQNSVTINYLGTIYNSFQSYVNATQQDIHSIFINPLLSDTNISTLNLHLKNSSPAKNVGDPNFVVGFNELDIDRESRIYAGRVDCGSDENQPFSGITLISSKLPDKFNLSQNYPNPFNPNTIIEFSLPVSTYVTLKVYNINGKEIKELVNENLTVGKYRTEFSTQNLSSGTYFYKLTTDKYSETKKMIVLK